MSETNPSDERRDVPPTASEAPTGQPREVSPNHQIAKSPNSSSRSREMLGGPILGVAVFLIAAFLLGWGLISLLNIQIDGVVQDTTASDLDIRFDTDAVYIVQQDLLLGMNKDAQQVMLYPDYDALPPGTPNRRYIPRVADYRADPGNEKYADTLGIVAAVFRGRPLDQGLMVTSFVAVSAPQFVVGLLLLYLFAVQLGWFPIGGYGTFAHLVLPAITLGIMGSGWYSRMMRSSMVEVLRQDYIRTARAKGLTRRQALWRHAVRNALIPVLTIIGLQFSFLLAGGIIIEQVFFLPGLGRLIFQSISARDLIVVESVVMLLVFVVITVNFAVDLAYAAVDPRLRSKA